MSHSDPDSRAGMSTATKVMIGLAVTAGLGLAICCGFTIWGVNLFQQAVGEFADAMTNNPAEIRELTDSMVAIEVPDGWQPVMGMQWSFGTEMSMAHWSPNQMQGNRILMLMQMRGAGVNQQQMEQQMQMQMNQQGMNSASGVQSSETRTFVIDGHERDFLFMVVNDGAGGTMHQVQGVFPGRNGTVMLMFMEDDANWDEDIVVRMIESISTESPPAGAAPMTPADTPSIPDAEPSGQQ